MIPNGEKVLRNVNVVVWRQVKRENSSLQFAVRVSKTRVLKLPIGILPSSRSRLNIRLWLRRFSVRLTFDNSIGIAWFSWCSLKCSLVKFADRPVPKALDIFWCGSITANDVWICMWFEPVRNHIRAYFQRVRHFHSMPRMHVGLNVAHALLKIN